MCAVDLIPEQGGNAHYPRASCRLNFPEVVTVLASSSFLHGENCFGFKACLVCSPGHSSNLIYKKGMKWAEGLAGWLRELAAQSWRPEFGSQLPGWQVAHPKHTCSLPLRARSREDCWGLLAFSPFEKMRATGSRRGPAQNEQEDWAREGHPPFSSALHSFAQVCAPTHTSAHTLTQAFRDAHISNTLF